MRNLFILKAKCSECRKDFYIRYDKSVKDKWVRTYGLKTIPVSESTGDSDMQIDERATYVGAQYSCPWCGRKNWFRCGKCKQFSCRDAKIDGRRFHCPYCDNEGELTGKSSGKSTFYIEGSSGTGQG